MQIARMTDLPALVDADTGFGEPMNVARTVQELEDAGVAGLHIEDQVNPKRCGHLDGKQVVDTATAVAADPGRGRRPPGPEPAHHGAHRRPRGRRPATPRSTGSARSSTPGRTPSSPRRWRLLAEFEAVASAVDVPVLANMTEFGKSELFTADQLAAAGVRIVIHPVSLLRVAMGAAERALDTLVAEGSLRSQVAGDADPCAALRAARLRRPTTRFDTSVYNFTLPAH